MNTRYFRILLLCGLSLCVVPTAVATDFLYTLGFGSARGDYGLGTDVTTLWMVNNLEVRGKTWSIEVLVPIIRQDSADLTWVGGMPMPRGMGGDGGHGGGLKNHHPGHGHPGMDDPSTGDVNTGFADPILRLGVDIMRSFSGASLFRGNVVVKAPVGDETLGFSTGEWDYGAGFSYLYSGYRSSVIAELTYWQLGDPLDVELKNPIAFRLITGFNTPGGRYLVEAFLAGQTEIVDGAGNPVSIGMTLNRNLTTRYSIFGSGAAGLTNAASDYALSAGLRISF